MNKLKPLVKKVIGYGSTFVLVMVFGSDFVITAVNTASSYLSR